MTKVSDSNDVIGVSTEHNPTLHLWMLTASILVGSVASLFLVASIIAHNIFTMLDSMLVAALTVWAIRKIINRMQWS